MPSSSRRLLLASIHDVSPKFEAEVDCLVERLHPHVEKRIAMLVVPNHWGEAPIIRGSPFATRLRAWAEGGFEIFLHGYFHRDLNEHSKASDRLRARFMTASEGEFLGLPEAEASARIVEGRSLVEDIIGRPVEGFVAPAWLYGAGARRALAETNIPLSEDHLRVWSPSTGKVLAKGPVITWASRTRLRLASSLAASLVLRRAPIDVLRVAVHPPDSRHPAILGSVEATFDVARRRRTAARYSDLLQA